MSRRKVTGSILAAEADRENAVKLALRPQHQQPNDSWYGIPNVIGALYPLNDLFRSDLYLPNGRLSQFRSRKS